MNINSTSFIDSEFTPQVDFSATELTNTYVIYDEKVVINPQAGVRERPRLKTYVQIAKRGDIIISSEELQSLHNQLLENVPVYPNSSELIDWALTHEEGHAEFTSKYRAWVKGIDAITSILHNTQERLGDLPELSMMMSLANRLWIADEAYALLKELKAFPQRQDAEDINLRLQYRVVIALLDKFTFSPYKDHDLSGRPVKSARIIQWVKDTLDTPSTLHYGNNHLNALLYIMYPQAHIATANGFERDLRLLNDPKDKDLPRNTQVVLIIKRLFNDMKSLADDPQGFITSLDRRSLSNQLFYTQFIILKRMMMEFTPHKRLIAERIEQTEALELSDEVRALLEVAKSHADFLLDPINTETLLAGLDRDIELLEKSGSIHTPRVL